MTQYSQQKGALLVLILVFGAVFTTIIFGFMNYIVSQYAAQQREFNDMKAREIAEAGINYYKWFLAHNPDDVQHGTTTPGPYVVEYEDPEEGPIGAFSLDITSREYCGEVSSIYITSTGYTYENPSSTRSVYAHYAQPTVTEYAYIINSNVWAGADRTIIGPYHSNGGVRMDGTNNSTVTSGQATWNCTNSFGCIPSDSNADGVVGSGPNSDLWSFPSPPINFTGLTLDLSTMAAKAQDPTTGGIFIPESSGYGYRVQFRTDGTVDVYQVDSVYTYEGFANGSWSTEEHIIDTESFVASYALDTSCPLIFVEDKVWLGGNVQDKISLAAADIDTPGVDRSIILQENIQYGSSSAGLIAVAEEDVLLGVNVPEDMEINGVFMAQNGRFGRNHYERERLPRTCVGWVWLWCVAWSEPFAGDVFKDSLTINGTIFSNGRVGTQWTSGGTPISGFLTRYNSYDRNLVIDPPPLTPNTSEDYRFIEWRDVD